jgi:AraC-like DNA-binding protein
VYKKATLPNGKGNLEVGYTGLSFIVPKKITFKYRLEGYDTKWLDAGTRRKASYTGLPYGSYRFRVIACNRDGVWNNNGASFDFYMKPNFYQTLTFYILFPLFLLSIAAASYISIKKYHSFRKLRNKYRGSNLKPEEAKECLRKMLYLIEVEEVYKDPEISLQSLSKKLSISPRNLSQIINEQMKKNFYELINQYRVQEAKKMLTSPSKHNLSILEIGYDVGFSSKSVLNRAFKHFTKQTPSEYRERYKSSNT